jgi:hypothetical protein
MVVMERKKVKIVTGIELQSSSLYPDDCSFIGTKFSYNRQSARKSLQIIYTRNLPVSNIQSE